MHAIISESVQKEVSSGRDVGGAVAQSSARNGQLDQISLQKHVFQLLPMGIIEPYDLDSLGVLAKAEDARVVEGFFACIG